MFITVRDEDIQQLLVVHYTANKADVDDSVTWSETLNYHKVMDWTKPIREVAEAWERKGYDVAVRVQLISEFTTYRTVKGKGHSDANDRPG